MNRVAFVMVNHNGGEEVLHSVRSVLMEMTEEDRLVLVDNGTSDGSGQRVYEEFPDIHYIGLADNHTFAAANNHGIRWALKHKFSFIGPINPDVRLKPVMIDRMVRHLSLIHI